MNKFVLQKIVMPKLLLSIALVAILSTPSSSAQSEPKTQIGAIKQNANLKDLEKTDELSNVGVFIQKILTDHIGETQNLTTRTDAAIFKYFEKQFKLLNIDENVADSILTRKILKLEATTAEMKKQVSNLKNIARHQHQKELETESHISHLQHKTNVLQQKLECALNPCSNGGQCILKNNRRHCDCSAGFKGDNCENIIDVCARHNSCLNGGTCKDGTSNFTCACAQGFTGNQCEISIDDCTYCLNGGSCMGGDSSYTCTCTEEYFGNHCEHRNECVYSGTCISLSTLSRDAKCKCKEGYAPDPYDSRRCKPVDKNLNENATLIFGSYGSGRGIQQFSLNQQTVERIQNHSLIDKALDVMYRANTMFWSDESGNTYTAPIRQGAAKTLVRSDSGSRFLSLAVDWIYSHLYFADDNRDTISVTNLDGSMKKVLFTTGVSHTWAIVVDPLSGWIYWADYNARNIERAAMDGSGREVIGNTGSNIPVGLALDMTQNRLYWTILMNPSSIHSMNVDGSDKKIVYEDEADRRFWSITIFEDFVYWRDSPTVSIYRTNKCGGGNATAIYVAAHENDAWLTLQAYHFSKQPEGVNYCENRISGQCSHLCFRIPSMGNHTVATTCACPDRLTLSSDQRTCT